MLNEQKITKEVARVFKVILTTRTEIKIDPDEVSKVLEALQTGSAVILRQGIIANPNTISAIIEDEDRRIRFLEDTRYDLTERERGILVLRSIFEKINLSSNKSLKSGK